LRVVGQRVEQILCQPVSEVLLILLGAQIDQWQHGNRLGG
jgi:hypothetical protein